MILAVSVSLGASQASPWLDVPFVRQSKKGCGPAVVAMIVQYWRAHGATLDADTGDPARIAEAMQDGLQEGVLASEIARYLRGANFDVYTFRGSWDELAHHLELGRPLIVAFRPAGSSSLHYVVVAGLDHAQRVVKVNDPARRKLLKVDRSEFEKGWKETRDWTLLALPPASR